MPNSRLKRLFAGSENGKKIFSIFVTAGFPGMKDTVSICETLAESGVGMIELGIPFSDSIADGPTIQAANEKALANGVTLEWTLETLRKIRKRVDIPIILMGSLNPVLQHGVGKFCRDAKDAGADGTILPDLPLEIYLKEYKEFFAANDLSNVFLVTSNTSDKRIRQIDEASGGFIYAVSMPGVTGKGLQIDEERRGYLERLAGLNLSSPLVVGFGIEQKEQFLEVTKNAAGAIVGSAFIKAIEKAGDVKQATKEFVGKFIEPGK